MATVFLNSVSEASLQYQKIATANQENPQIKTYNGKTYAYYGKAVNPRKFCWKVGKLFQLVCTSFLVPLTLGIIAASKSFRALFARKVTKLKEPDQTINIFVKQPQKQNTAAEDMAEEEEWEEGLAEFVEELAKEFVQDEEHEKTLEEIEVIQKHFDHFKLKLAETYFKNGDLNNAFKIIKGILRTEKNEKAFEDFTVKLAKAYSQAGNQDKALEVLKLSQHHVDS